MTNFFVFCGECEINDIRGIFALMIISNLKGSILLEIAIRLAVCCCFNKIQNGARNVAAENRNGGHASQTVNPIANILVWLVTK